MTQKGNTFLQTNLKINRNQTFKILYSEFRVFIQYGCVCVCVLVFMRIYIYIYIYIMLDYSNFH